MRNSTKRLQIETGPEHISKELVDFLSENVKRHPGKSSLKFCINNGKPHLKFGMFTLENGFEMNDEMATYLQQKPELDIAIELT